MDAMTLAAFGVAIPLVVFLNLDRSRSLLEQWAERNGFRVVASERRVFFRGPFFWSTTSVRGPFFSTPSRTVFYVTVEDASGARRTGYVRCGGSWLVSDDAEVVWD